MSRTIKREKTAIRGNRYHDEVSRLRESARNKRRSRGEPDPQDIRQ